MKSILIFLDRDGVIIENRPDYVKDVDEIQIYDNAPEAIKILNDLGKVYVVTNQSCVGRGIISETWAETLSGIMELRLMADEAWIDEIFMCPHAPEDDCECRKPKPGLWFEGFNACPESGPCFMVGDSKEDIEGALALGITPFLVMTGRGEETLKNNPSFEAYKCDNLLYAAMEIEKLCNAESQSTPAENVKQDLKEATEA